MAENWYEKSNYYKVDGTSAYKIEEYERYTEESEQRESKRSKSKALVVNHKKTILITLSVFALAIAFLYANVLLIRVSDEYEECTTALEDIKVRNTQASFEITSGIDLAVVEEKAKTEFSMQQPESHQNVYVDVVQSDYAEAIEPAAGNGSITDNMIAGLKSFLEYIG